MDDNLKKLVACGEHCEIRIQHAIGQKVSIVGGNLVANTTGSGSGASARVYKNGVWGFSAFSAPEKEDIVKIFSKARENAELLDSRRPKNKGPLTLAAPVVYEEKKPILVTAQKTLVEFARQLADHIKEKYPKLVSSAVVINSDCKEKELYTSFGTFSYQIFPRTYVIVQMSAEANDGETIELFDVLGGGYGFFEEYYSDPAALYEKIDSLYNDVMDKCEGIYPEAGSAQCIIDSAIAGMIAHEAVGHTVEADLVLSGSVASGSLGKCVASPLVNLTDFASEAFGGRAPLPVYVDDEGIRCTDAVLIKDGILTGYMNNLESAQHFGMTPCGNARAFGYSDEPIIRMRNTCILPGSDKLEDMIASVDSGYYLTGTGNGQADMTGEFMFSINKGREIKNGKPGRALRDTTISGVAFDMLKTVDMLSDSVTWDFAGYCGKKQPMTVSMGGPCVRCTVNIGGR